MGTCSVPITGRMEIHSISLLQNLCFVVRNSLMSHSLNRLHKQDNPFVYTLGINFRRPRVDIPPTRKLLAATIGKYIDQGITAFDTADSYGYRNEIIGTFLRNRNREQFQIISKTYFPFPGQNPTFGNLSAKNIELSINFSLKALRTDYLDILLAHRFDFKTDLGLSSKSVKFWKSVEK